MHCLSKLALATISTTIVSLGISNAAEAASITFDFQSILNGNPFGTGSFSYDDSLGTIPVTTVLTPDVLDFSYSDPVVGTLTRSNLASFQFTIGSTPTTSLFTFVAASPDNLRSFNGGAVDANNLGGLSISNNFVTGGFANPSLRFPVIGASTPIPTPALLPGLVGLGIAAVRKAQKQLAS